MVNQTYKNLEVILINDGSTDDSAEIAQIFVEKDQRFHLVNQENAGPAAARNKGIESAKGNYLFFVDADDSLTNNALELMINAIEMKQVDLVCAGYFEMNSKYPKGLALHDFPITVQNQIIDKKTYQKNLFNGVSGVLWGKLFKKNIFKQFNIRLNSNIKLSEDLLVVIAYSLHLQNVYILEQEIYYYNRLGESGLSRKLKEENLKDLQQTNQEILKYKDDLEFLDLKEIVEKRDEQFVLNYLKQNSEHYEEYKRAIHFIFNNFDQDLLKKIAKPSQYLFLRLLIHKKSLLSYLVIKTENKLRKLKQQLTK